MSPRSAETLRMTKHHGAGNDFLVVLDPVGEIDLTDGEVSALSDRRCGVGADGVIRVGPPLAGADLSMDLRNADGSRAAMSGNGMRCLAQAVVDARLVTTSSFRVATPGGVRAVRYRRTDVSGGGWASVEMGAPLVGAELGAALGAAPFPASWGGRVRRVDVGNPHLVALGGDLGAVDVTGVGSRLGSSVEGGANVEFVALGEHPDELVLRVWERGVGETMACGTGSVAAAAAAAACGMVGSRVLVQNPGGTLEVVLDGVGGAAHLAGPVRRVAEVIVDRSSLA